MKKLSTQLPAMLKTIEGIYQNGKIELTELPQDVSDLTQVIVTFLDPGKVDRAKLLELKLSCLQVR